MEDEEKSGGGEGEGVGSGRDVRKRGGEVDLLWLRDETSNTMNLYVVRVD